MGGCFAGGNRVLGYFEKNSTRTITNADDCSDFPLETVIEPARIFWTLILISFRRPKRSCHASLRKPLTVEAVAIPGLIHEGSETIKAIAGPNWMPTNQSEQICSEYVVWSAPQAGQGSIFCAMSIWATQMPRGMSLCRQ
jgi:hypothetical protein